MPTKIWREFTVIKVEAVEKDIISTFWFHLDKGVRYSCGETTKIRVTKHHPQFDFNLITEEFKSFKVEVSGTLSALGFDSVFDISRIRRPILETLSEELKAANKTIQDLENKLEAEKETHQAVLPAQLNYYRKANIGEGDNPIYLADIFAELEGRMGKENVNVDKWLPNIIRLLLWKEQKAKSEKEQIEEQKDKQIKQKDKINSKYQKKIRRIKRLVVQNNYWTDQDNKLRATIKDLQDQTANHNCSGCHVPAHADYHQIKQDKQNLENKLSRKQNSKKNLSATIKELKNEVKNQKEELTTSQEKLTKQQKTIKELKKEKKDWQQREQQLLAEIELLKNPPLTNSNKENLKQKTIVKEVIKEIIIKNLENNNKELGLNLSSPEKVKLNNLPLEEVKNYQVQLVKNKFNNLEKQIKELSDNKIERERERERERETKILLFWLLICCLVLIALNFVVKKIRRIKKGRSYRRAMTS